MDCDEQALAKLLMQARTDGDRAAEISAGLALMAKHRMRIRAAAERASGAIANDNR